MECRCSLHNIHDSLADGKTSFQKKTQCSRKCSECIFWNSQQLSKWARQMLSGIFMGYVLHTGDGWTGDLLIAGWSEKEACTASDVHVERFSSQAIGVTTVRGYLVFPCAHVAL